MFLEVECVIGVLLNNFEDLDCLCYNLFLYISSWLVLKWLRELPQAQHRRLLLFSLITAYIYSRELTSKYYNVVRRHIVYLRIQFSVQGKG